MPVRIVFAPDSFKESLTAAQVCAAMQAGFEPVFPDAEYIHVPMADGGEGTVQSLVDSTGGTLHRAGVTGPLGEPVEATYGILGDGTTGVIEMAAASGLELVLMERRDARISTTFGTGELILACLDRGVRRLIIGIGGSATNDGGAGMAVALGARLLDGSGRELAPGGAALADLATLDTTGLDLRLRDLEIQVACDVTNPLCGPDGATHVYGPQKGLSAKDINPMDDALAHYASVLRAQLGKDVADVPGAGAAGGLGAGLLAFTSAQLRSGVEIVMEQTRLREAVRGAALVVTGEGRMDGQTRNGKTPYGVARVAHETGVPVIGIAGSVGEGIETLDLFDAVLPVVAQAGPLEDALRDAAVNVERTCRNAAQLLRLRLE